MLTASRPAQQTEPAHCANEVQENHVSVPSVTELLSGKYAKGPESQRPRGRPARPKADYNTGEATPTLPGAASPPCPWHTLGPSWTHRVPIGETWE
jgi:hypothetical protein